MKNSLKILLLVVCFQFYSCSDSDDKYVDLVAEEGEQYSGGETTFFNTTEEAFGFSAPNLTFDEQSDFGIGNSFFRQSWVTAPSSTTARDGLGPFFNAVSCSSCHFKDGRGRAPLFDGETAHGLLLRLSIAGVNTNGSSFADPIYGGQMQDNAILGQTLKGRFNIVYQDIIETLADGTVVTLRKPTYVFNSLGYGPLANDLKVSPRVANQMIGLGLLEAIDESTLLAFADVTDVNNDGISGKVNYVYDVATNSKKIGRFGWKANQPNVRQQVAAAFSGDIGITSSLFPNENCPPGVDCNAIANGGSPEITDANLDKVALYSSTLAVPGRRNYTEQNVLEGKKVFETINCTSCHIPKIKTGNTHVITALRNQTIRPYTDLLLHDMGIGLADNAPDFEASGLEWRTQPLWGIGLIFTVNGHTNLLHDGRARNVTEAILWHGGEAEKAKNSFKQLTTKQRTQLLEFIDSL
ncbi:di-heme oxidoreductase family protein [Flavobacterium muglaense]|uniref:C-type cytochrome n=1 Tax=Flavobacterium muglaense TaxID=2764716 RepID=A0A923SGJ0_9FLAO|nr:di-heme oxidoredictase family protein [Flavobacterium muglaense]MBC5839275.1 c-type cytochrome [Flavobacterium muglaense]MBC5845787.1 c-type cytochrome [Flavobacterium muglaense]